MNEVFSITEAKVKFSQIINRVIYKKEKILISKWGRKVAVILPFEDINQVIEEELLDAKPLLAEAEGELDQISGI